MCGCGWGVVWWVVGYFGRKQHFYCPRFLEYIRRGASLMLCYSTTLLDFSRRSQLATSIPVQGVGTSIVGNHIYIHICVSPHTHTNAFPPVLFFIKVSQVSSFFFLNLLLFCSFFSIWLLVAGVGGLVGWLVVGDGLGLRVRLRRSVGVSVWSGALHSDLDLNIWEAGGFGFCFRFRFRCGAGRLACLACFAGCVRDWYGRRMLVKGGAGGDR